MQDRQTAKRFTGRHMAAILVGGFGIVVAVNFTMASYATGGFHGVVVENSYVASQEFNTWLDKAEADRALGWDARLSRDDSGHVLALVQNVPSDADLSAELRRPIGEKQFASLSFERLSDGTYRSTEPVSDGRWIARLYIEAGDDQWAQESELP